MGHSDDPIIVTVRSWPFYWLEGAGSTIVSTPNGSGHYEG